MNAAQIHGLFGYSLIAAGVLRIVEVCFVLNDQPTTNTAIRTFQHLPPYVSNPDSSCSMGLCVDSCSLSEGEFWTEKSPMQNLTQSRTLFMSATDEEMHNADK